VKRFQSQYLRQNGPQNAIVSVVIPAVSISTVVAIFVAATKTLPEIVVVVVPFYVIAVITVVRVPISVRVSVVVTPAILAVCPPCPETFLITIVNGLAKIIRAVLVGLVVVARTTITIGWSRIEIRIAVVIGVTIILKKYLLLAQVLEILPLDPILRHALLLL
jgi:hypothetical protein